MRKLAILIFAVSLSACATVQNPATIQQLYDVEAAYGVALATAVAYHNRPLCKTGTVESLTNICARRSIVVKLQLADKRARAALAVARAFIINNPTLSAVSALTAAQSAVVAFQTLTQ